MKYILLISSVLLLQVSTPAFALSDDEIKQLLVEESVLYYLTYHGNCPCPYTLDRAGRRCGKRSAYSKPGGQDPLCYAADITDQMIEEYNKKIK